MYVTSDGVQLRLSARGSEAGVVKNPAAHLQTGSWGNDVFYSASGDTDVGGTGDDSYYIWSVNNTIVEWGGGGVDTVYGTYWGTYTLAAYVENLVLSGGGMTWNTGNALANIMAAGSAPSFLDGAAGNDVLVGGTDRDIFNIRRGNGADVVERFAPGEDQIRLQGYDVASYAALRATMTQVGDDVLVRLPPGETLTIRDTDLADLSATDFVLANASATQTVLGALPPPTSGLVRLPDLDSVALGKGWIGWANCYGTGDLVEGRDFTASTSYRPADLTAGITFTWSFPTVPTGLSIAPDILAFPELLFGNAPKSGFSSNPGDTEHAFPVQVGSVERLLLEHDVSFSGDTRGFDVAYDLWLSSTPTGGRSTITNEIMIWVHQGDFAAYGEYLGVYEDGDLAATVYYDPVQHLTTFVATADLPSATIDVARILDYLEARGIVGADEYFRDVELGAEVVSGAGSLTIGDLEILIETSTATGSLIKTVTGTGTTVTRSFDGTEAGDVITGTPGDDIVTGGAGNDVIDGAGGADRLDGGAGWDTASFAGAAARVIVNLSLQGQAQNTGGGGVDTLVGFEHLVGSAFDDRLYGDLGQNRIGGGAGDDVLFAGSESDVLTGGAGADLLYGGSGADRFVYAAAGDSIAAAPDTIADFASAKGDTIDLSAVDANALAGGVQHFRYVGTAAFAAAGDLRVSYAAGYAMLTGDTDGDRVADFAIRLEGVDAAHPLAGWDLILG